MTETTPDIAVIFGATGGIGAALTRRITASGHYGSVLELGRTTKPGFDLTDEASIAAALSAVAEKGSIRLALDATGYLHDSRSGPEKSLRDIDPEAMARSFALNAIGPALLFKHLVPLLPRQGRTVLATLSARVGSISDNRMGGWYAYRASKAALNQITRSAAIEIARKRPEAICVALHPGTVDTGLSRPFARDGLEVQSPDDAAERLMAVIDGLTPADTGGFFDHKGLPVPW
ncbi:SDR family NAD(P)-dependent oxidoreductase [Pelagibacterium montanilacus]|uniref:SDR family NAD(P)-dependent oxidoreductase n=1 Tax=Pelagibacterium montanilacus TaxID=2185280 RepID=UPI000F8E5AB4|nr:SDR family NAD(P)-dependent oxidoreductase [Pelagibacterium montanilacus]